MAASLRHPLGWLVWLAMAVIYLPILPAGTVLFAPAFSVTNWQRLLNDPQLPQAAVATLVSTLIATLGALFIALSLVALFWPGTRWRRLSTRLPWLLAIPHEAFATSALLLFAEGGLFYQVCTVCSPPFDRYGVGLGLTLAVKESAFVLWAIYAVLPEKGLAQQKIVLQTFGYGRFQTLSWLILPAIAPVLGAVMLAVLAWSLSVVDVAIVLGPGNPPTLAVLAWQWLSQGDAQQQVKGTLLCLVLLLLLAALAALGYGLWKVWRRAIPDLSGTRRRLHLVLPERAFSGFLPACGLLCAAVLLMLAQRDDVGPVGTSLSFGLLSSLIALIVIFLWLEWGPRRGVGVATARPSGTAARHRAIRDCFASGSRRRLYRRPLEPSAVGATVDAAGAAARLAADRSPAYPYRQNARLAAGKNFLPAEMSPAGASCAAGLCHRLFRQHGPIYADPVAGRGTFRHADHRDRRAQQRRQHPASR